jgi:hypothetical protein
MKTKAANMQDKRRQEPNDRNRLRQWLADNTAKQTPKPLPSGCHCGEGCGAWYNLD